VAPPPVRSPRVLGATCAGLVLAAALLWGASAASWEADGGRTGAQAAPSLTGVALLALAGVAGVLATGGVARRLVGGLLVLAGGVQAVSAATAVGGGSPGPLLAVAGGLLLLAAGLLVVLREQRLPRFGSRYARGGRRAQRDPDRAAWEALDAGEDPTAGPASDTDDGDQNRRG
jgi:hypothetical protein